MRSEEAVQTAIDQYGDMVLRICFLHAKQKADAQDVFQNVFFKYAKSEHTFTSSEHEKAWFIRVTINCCKDYLKSWFMRNVDSKEDMSMFASTEKTHDSHVLHAVMQLPKKYRDVIYLYYYEGYSNVEIAKLLNKNENTIYTWQNRAKKILKTQLGGDEFET